MTKGYTERAETVRVDPDLVSDYSTLTEQDKIRALAIAIEYKAHRSAEFLDWYMSLGDGADVQIGLAVTEGNPHGMRTFIIQSGTTTWHFTPDEVFTIVMGVDYVNACWTAKTGRAPHPMSTHLVQGLRMVFRQYLDVSAETLENIEAEAQTDQWGRKTYDDSDKGRFKPKH